MDPSTQALAFSLLALLVFITPTHERLFPFGYQIYNNGFKLAEAHYELNLGTTAHSGRSGFATRLVLQGHPRKEVQARGRWLSESSFNTYIDTAGASHIAAQVSGQKLEQTARWIQHRIWRYFDLPESVDVSSQPGRLSGASDGSSRFQIKVGQGPDSRAPDYLSAHQKRHWRQQKWNELFGKQENLQVGAPVQATTPQPKAKARAAAYFGGGGIRRVRSSVRSRLWQWLWRCCGGSVVTLVAILLLAVYGGAEGPLIQVGRLLGIAADLGEATSVAAGQAVNVTGAIAHAATDVITSATSNGLNSAENIWRGIDISQLVAHRCAGIMTMDDEHVLANWLNSSASSVLVPCMEKPDVGSRSLRVAFTYIIANFIRDLGAYNFI